MSTTIRDASLTTARRRQLALYAYRQVVSVGAGTEQAPSMGNIGTGPSAEVPTNVRLGALLIAQTAQVNTCGCSPNTTLQGYDKKSPAC